MRTFIVLCFVAVACAQYNYQPAGQAAEGGFDGGFAGAVDGGFSGAVDGGLVGPSFAGLGDVGGASYDVPAVADFEKEFYSYTANDNDFNDDGAQQAANSVKQGIRVVFIKGPENRGLENAALALAKQAGEQKTAIYVLNKQADIGDLANKLNNINNSGNNKPEVHFVKYRTQEDAANAQRAIQGQYDSLGGNTRTVNGGVAPVLNFASQAPVSSNYRSAATIEAPTNSYIPPSAAATYIPPAAPTNSYIPPAPVVAPTNSYIPPAPVAAPINSYIPPAPVAAPTNSYIPPAPAAAEPGTNYLPASILRLFRL